MTTARRQQYKVTAPMIDLAYDNGKRLERFRQGDIVPGYIETDHVVFRNALQLGFVQKGLD